MGEALESDDDVVSTRDPEPSSDPPARRPRTATPNPEPKYDEPADDPPDPQKIIADQAAKLRAAEERANAVERERLEWQQQRDALQRERDEATQGQSQATRSSLDAAITAEERRIQAAKQQFRHAREAGDFDAEEQALDQMQEARARHLALQREKQSWDQWEEHQKRERENVSPQPKAPQQRPAQQYAPEAQRWVEEHPRFNEDPVYRGIVMGAHEKAVRDGAAPNSRLYFQMIDQAVSRFERLESLDRDDGERTPDPPPRRQQPSAASMAPSPSRGSGERKGREPSPEAVARKMGLTVDDLRSWARTSGMSFNDYVKSQAEEVGL